MKIDFKPKSLSARWAVGFGIALVMLTALPVIFAFAIGGDPAVIENNSLLKVLAAALSIMFTLAGPLSFFTGIYSIIKHKEYSVVKPLVVLYILTLLLFMLGEFSFPH